METIPPGHRGDSGIVAGSEMCFLKNHVMVSADEPRQQGRETGLSQRFIAEGIRIGGQHDGAAAYRALDENRVFVGALATGIVNFPIRTKIVEVKCGMNIELRWQCRLRYAASQAWGEGAVVISF